MFLNIFILFFALQHLDFQCTQGCLKCGQDNSCIFCDTISGYKKKDNSCVKVQKENCAKMNLEGNCLVCINETFNDPQTNKCIKVQNPIENCIHYQMNQACLQCRNGYYMENGICFKVPEEIQYCKVYQNQSTCIECTEGYILQQNQKKCTIPPFIPNCKNYTYLQCNGCQQGYQLDHNFYFNEIFKFEDAQDLQTISDNLQMHQTLQTQINKKYICQQIQAKNCQTYKNFKQCNTCKLNYFMNGDGVCQEFPKEQIYNCSTYRNEQECIECNEGFFLENIQKCTPIQVIENCILYDNTKDKSYCSQCSPNYYSQGEKCIQRVNSIQIENCIEQKSNLDECKKCIMGQLLTGDSLKCLPIVENCKVHEVKITNKETQQFQCTECNDQYYFNMQSKQCVKGNTVNCLIYENNKDQCKVCQNKYYLENLQCFEHSNIDECEEYSQVQKGSCNKCNFFSQRFQNINKCIATSSVENCKKYGNDLVCIKCKDLYYLNDNKCLQNPQELNCKVYNGIQCEHCKDNYILLNGKCYQGFNSLTQNCYKDNIQIQKNIPVTFGDVKCDICSEGFITQNFQDNLLCLETSFLDTPIQNCQQYDENNNCMQCNDDYYLQENKCISLCQNTIKNIVISQIEISKLYQVSQRNICLDKNENCVVKGITNNLTQLSYKCFQCDENNIQLIDPSLQEYVITNKKFLKIQDTIQDPLSEQQSISCVNKDQAVIRGNINLDFKEVKNCQYYQQVNTNVYGCYKCKFGYRGVLKKIQEDQKFYIESCDENIECDRSIQFNGLLGHLDKLVSCHECLNKNQKLFIPYAWNFDNNYPEQQQEYVLQHQDKSYSQFCSSLDHNLFSIAEDKFKVPENCAFYGYNTLSEKDASSSSTIQKDGGQLKSMQILCLACMPMFAPVYFSQTQLIPVQCNLIQNCKKSNWINACSECEENHSYLYTTNQGIQYDKCIKNTFDPNCLVIDTSDPENPGCYKCKKQFYKNLDGVCEQTVVPNCSSTNVGFKNKFELKNLKFELWNNNFGCNKCDDNYYLKQFNVNFPVCVQSSYLRYQNFKKNTKYILNCSNYENSINTKCAICHTGYVLSQDKLICYGSLNLDNCQIAKTEKYCSQCKTGFVSVQGKCQVKSLNNCEDYEQNPDQVIQKCIKCSDLFYLHNGKCIEGELEGCLQYVENNSQKCRQYKGSYSYCYPINRNLNCLEFSDKFLNYELECLTCLDGYYIQDLNIKQDICMGFNSIIGCQKYLKIPQDDQYLYQCIQCTENHFYDKYKCKIRKNQGEGVKEYDKSSDTALQCQQGYYLNYEGLCKQNPTGIQGCVIYETQSICSGCKENHYLVNNQCIFVQEVSRIENCLYYETLKECKGCEQGFYHEKGQCLRVEALNCNTYTDKKTCKSCQPGYGLKNQDGITNCVVVNQPNCLYYGQQYPWTCLLCEQGYYPNHQGTCSLILNQIQNCLYYDTENTCQQCAKGSILSIDKKQCIFEFNSLQDQNCSSYKKIKNPICSQCNQGYFFENGKCVMCRKYTVTSGCFTCDPYNQENCLLCKPGYYQNNQNQCISQEISIDDEESEQNEINFNKLIMVLYIYLCLFL